MPFSRVAVIVLCLTTVACGGSAPTAPPAAPPPATFTLSGRVSDVTSGTALAGATVTIIDGANLDRTTLSDSGGAFRLTGLTAGGFTLRVRADGYDAAFRGITFVADTAIDVPMTRARQTLAGTWTGTLSLVPTAGPLLAVDIPQAAVQQSGSSVSSSFNAAGPYQVRFDGTIQDQSSIAAGTPLTGTMTITIDMAGRGPLTCTGTSAFTGAVTWTTMTATAPRVAFECGIVYSNVRFALERQQ